MKTIRGSTAALTLCMSLMFASLIALLGGTTSAAPIRCTPGTTLQCTSEAGPVICTCVPVVQTYSVTGTVTGLAGKGLQLAFNAGQQDQFSVEVFPNGQVSQQLSLNVPAGPYVITVLDEPTNPQQACTVSDGTGTADPLGSTPFGVNCGVGYTVGGMIDGLLGVTLALAANNTSVPQGAVVQSNGQFVIPWLVADSQTYRVTIAEVPPGQTCTIANNFGTIRGANVTTVSVNCSGNPGPGTDVVCDPWGCISLARLSYNIVNILQNNVVGFAVKVGDQQWTADGQARTTKDPPAKSMSEALPINIESVSKTITAIAIMQLLGKNHLTIDANIWPFVYPDWSRDPTVNQITFKEVLTHTSGFGQVAIPQSGGQTIGCGSLETYDQIKTLVAHGVQPSDIGKPSYGNCNFALLRELMPGLANPSTFNMPDGTARATQSSTDYVNYMNAKVFMPLNISMRYCPLATSNTDQILAYPFPAGSTPGNSFFVQGECGPGSW